MTEEIMLDVLKAYYQKQKLIFDDDLKQLVTFAVSQSLTPYLYLVSENKIFKQLYLSSYMTQQKFIFLQNELTELFNQNEIEHYYIKGSILYKLYDDIALRTRGDIDVVIEEKNLKKVKKLLVENDYEYVCSESSHHLKYHKNNLEVEIHFGLFDIHSDYYQKYLNSFKFTKLEANYLYKINDNDHYVYCLCHFAKHLSLGTGIRLILDFYYMAKKTNIDFSYIKEEIRLLNLEVLHNNILNAIYIITNEKITDFEEKNIDFFFDYLLKSGIHGIHNLKELDENKLIVKKNKISYAFSRLFLPNKAKRQSLYPKLGQSIIFYPLILIHRTFYLFTHSIKKLFQLFNPKKKAKKNELEELYKKIGI